MIIRLIYILLFILCTGNLSAQEEKKSKIFKDTLDGKMDMSRFLIDYHGFIPVPQLITEPALGYVGLLLAPVFISPNKYPQKEGYTPPNITAAFTGYTANRSWFLGAFRQATLTRVGINYTVAGAYADVNLDFYRELPVVGETAFPFNFKTIPLYFNVTKQFGNSNFDAGIDYLFMKTEVSPKFEGADQLSEFFNSKTFDAIQSSPGILVEYDSRDNIFTPDKGIYATVNFKVNAQWTGSDFDFQNLVFYTLPYFQVTKNLVSGFRLETQQQFGNAPFYLIPGIIMRGVPALKYQGTSTYLMGTEQRYDFTLRWSGLAFGGVAKALGKNKSFSEANLIYNYGVGVRYLVARIFKIRMGVDVAWSNEDFGYYLVFGSYWR